MLRATHAATVLRYLVFVVASGMTAFACSTSELELRPTDAAMSPPPDAPTDGDAAIGKPDVPTDGEYCPSAANLPLTAVRSRSA